MSNLFEVIFKKIYLATTHSTDSQSDRCSLTIFSLFCQVDEEMREELAELKLAVDKEKPGKQKGPKVRTLKSDLILHALL